MSKLSSLMSLYGRLSALSNIWLAPVIFLIVRLKMAEIFFRSGWLKINNWDTTLLLFEYEHPVPGLSPEVASYLGVFGELVFSVLLALGLAARLGAVGLLIMTAVIEFTYQSFEAHLFWALLLAVIATRGPGTLSLDHLVCQRMRKS